MRYFLRQPVYRLSFFEKACFGAGMLWILSKKQRALSQSGSALLTNLTNKKIFHLVPKVQRFWEQ